MEARRNNPESLAFTKSFSCLLGIQYGLDTVASEAYAAGLIPLDLKNKCTGEISKPETQTRHFLNALQGRLESKPETLEGLVMILGRTSGLEHIGDELISSLDEAKKAHEQENQLSFTTPVHAHSQGVNTTPNRSHRKRSKDLFPTSLFGSMMNMSCQQEGTYSFGMAGTEGRRFSASSVFDTPPPTPR